MMSNRHVLVYRHSTPTVSVRWTEPAFYDLRVAYE